MLKNWKVWQKLTLIAVAMGFMVPVLLYLAVSARNEDIAFALKEEIGALYLRPLSSLHSRVLEHRGRSQALIGGDLSERPKIATLDPGVRPLRVPRVRGCAPGSTETC